MDNTNNVNFISYNCKNIKTAAQEVRDMCRAADLLALQETWLWPHDLGFVDELDDEFSVAAKSSMDTSVGVVRGRPYGGLALMWRKAKFRSVSVIECHSNRLLAIRITEGPKSFLVFNIYMPCDDIANLTEFSDCMARICAIIEEQNIATAYILGDFNAKPGALFGEELLAFCSENELVCADFEILDPTSPDTYTFTSQSLHRDANRK
ncbi:hypothetical protein O0L34_g8404 [Tuta absoluta]|nr:hypothetical protein O0L34_g8404 [Tuta absoluta]